MYIIETDHAACRISVTFDGLLSMDDVECFTREILAEVGSLRMQGKRQTILYDYTCAAIQSQEVIAALKELATTNRLNSKRVALYTAGQLAKTQARRIANGIGRFAIFDDRQAAIEWLDAA